MPTFSQRIGVKPTKTILQLESMDDDLRNGLWNVRYDRPFKYFLQKYFNPHEDRLVGGLWRSFLKLRADEIPSGGRDVVKFLKAHFFRVAWNEVYDLIESIAQAGGQIGADQEFPQRCNYILQREMAGYRFCGTTLARITDAEELQAIHDASNLSTPFQPVRAHISRAIALFSDRKSPDYRNSVKESISAVEAMCKIIAGLDNATLGQALTKLEEKGISLHAALRKSFSSLYGYTSDADGIRHALLEESTVDFDDAKFMLVSCSAFVNYLAAKSSKAG